MLSLLFLLVGFDLSVAPVLMPCFDLHLRTGLGIHF